MRPAVIITSMLLLLIAASLGAQPATGPITGVTGPVPEKTDKAEGASGTLVKKPPEAGKSAQGKKTDPGPKQARSVASGGSLKDLFYGEALFYAYQNRYFEAIARLDTELGQLYSQDEISLDPLSQHQYEAEFNIGDLEISYRMHQRAGRALKAIMEGKVDDTTRNHAAFRLAKIYFQKNQPVNALHVIDRIKGQVPASIAVEETFLRAQIYLKTGRFKEAIKLLQSIENEPRVAGFAPYNLGIAMIQAGDTVAGFKQLDKVGQLKSSRPPVLALRDKANLAVGFQLEKKGSAQLAKQFLARVRLTGPFSNKALLKAGWMSVAMKRYDRALVPWSLLYKRRADDASVQEALLAVPYAYAKLKAHGKAAVLYGQAMESFGREVTRLDDSIRSMRSGKFLEVLIKEESKKDKFWLLNLRKLPDAPETRYLMDLMAAHHFQESIKNYWDLAELRRVLERRIPWLDVYEEMIALRRQYYEPLLPVIETEFRNLDTRIKLRIGQRNRLEKRINSMLIARRPDYLATAFEHQSLEILKRMLRDAKKNPKRYSEQTMARINRLKGVIHWRLQKEYDQRLTKAYKRARELDKVIADLKIQYASFIRTRQAATQSYEGYDKPIRRLRHDLKSSLKRIKSLMARQGGLLEIMAIEELERRRKKLESYQVKARFALAESYDRANKEKENRLKIKEQVQKPEKTQKENEQSKKDVEKKDLTPKNQTQPDKTQKSPQENSQSENSRPQKDRELGKK